MTLTADASLLLLSDPAFAAGAGSFSSGLETLTNDAWLDSPDYSLEDVVIEALEHRWNPFERVFLAKAYAVDDDLARLVELGKDLDTHLTGASAREASLRAGTALLGLWARLGRSEAALLRGVDPAGVHLSIAQAFVARMNGLSLPHTELLSGWSLVSSLTSSAIRLGVSGHKKNQEIMIIAQLRLNELLEKPVPDDAQARSWTPHHDIAVERRSQSHLNLFSS